jgi:hypothetical protein
VLKLHDRGRRSVVGWARTFGGAGWDAANALVVQGPRVYVAGSFSSATARFGTHLLPNADSAARRYPHAPNFSANAFVAALDDAGPGTRVVWVHNLGGNVYGRLLSLALHHRQLYVAGAFLSPILPLADRPLPHRNPHLDQGIFLVCLTDKGPRGDCTWATQAGGPHATDACALASHGCHLYLAGTAADSTQLGRVLVRGRDSPWRVFVAGLAVPE